MSRKNALMIASGGMNDLLRRNLPTLGLVLLTALSTPAFAQMGGGGGNAEMQQKIQALKQSAAENKQRLHHYQWVETQQLTLKGEQKPEKVFQCSYGPNGQVQKIPMGEQQPAQQQRGLRGRIVEKKTDEMKDYMQQVQSLLSMYVPPNSLLIQKAIQSKNISIDKTMGGGPINIVIHDYAKPGDSETIAFDPAAKKISGINVNTYMDNPQDAVTLAVTMASLPDGTNYAQQTVLNATAKQIQVTTTNSNYAKLQ